MSIILSHWWIAPILLALICYKFILRVFFGMVIIPENRIGLVTKKFVLAGANKELPDGRIIATNGEAGYQAKPLSPGLHWGMWIWQYSVDQVSFITIPTGKIGLVGSKDGKPLPVGNILGRHVECDDYQDTSAFIQNGGQKGRQTKFLTAGTYRINTNMFTVELVDPVVIPDNKVGVVATKDGLPLPQGHIAGTQVDGHKNFQDFDAFLENGGQRGLQPQVIQSGTYNINPWAIDIELIDMTVVPIGNVGVVISYVGEDGVDVTGDTFKHGNIVTKGHRGVWNEPLGPGKYPINIYTHKVENVPTTNLVLNWANARNESHNLDKNLNTITVRSNDGFPFNLDVSQIIHVPANEAPKVIARFGNMINLVSQVLEPTIGNYFRNSAQNSDVIAFLSSRKERQDEAKKHISEVLKEYNVNAVDTLIGDIVPPQSLMKTLTDRKIAEEEQKTYKVQQAAEVVRQSFEKEKSIADMQGEIVKATQSVEIANRTADATVKTAEGAAKAAELKADAEAKATKLKAEAEAEQISKVGKATAESIEAQGKATATAYREQVSAMGQDNFGKLKVIEEISKGKVKVIPDLMINGGSGGTESPLNGLLGLQLLDMVKKREDQDKSDEKPENKQTSK